MCMRIWLSVILTTLTPSLSKAGSELAGAASDPNGELALRLFAEREWTRSSQLPYVFVYPAPGQFSAQALEQQNRAMLYWVWQPNKTPIWPGAPYRPSTYPLEWPIISPWMPVPLPAH